MNSGNNLNNKTDNTESQSIHKKTEKKQDLIILKMAIGGKGGVGKTTLCKQAVGATLGDFEEYKITIGVQFFTLVQDTIIGEVQLSVWDLAGQQQFEDIIKNFLTGSRGIILSYDVSSMESYFALHHTWIPLVRNNCYNNIPILIVSTKNDLEGEKEVQAELVQEFIDSGEHGLNIVGFLETSSLHRINVQETFSLMASKIIESELRKIKEAREREAPIPSE